MRLAPLFRIASYPTRRPHTQRLEAIARRDPQAVVATAYSAARSHAPLLWPYLGPVYPVSSAYRPRPRAAFSWSWVIG